MFAQDYAVAPFSLQYFNYFIPVENGIKGLKFFRQLTIQDHFRLALKYGESNYISDSIQMY